MDTKNELDDAWLLVAAVDEMIRATYPGARAGDPKAVAKLQTLWTDRNAAFQALMALLAGETKALH